MYHLLLIFSLFLPAPAPVTLWLAGHVGVAPLSVNVRITVQPNEQNRWVCLGYDGPESHTGCWSVEGESAPLTTYRLVKDLPAGHYELQAWVDRADGKTVRSDRWELQVLGLGSPD